MDYTRGFISRPGIPRKSLERNFSRTTHTIFAGYASYDEEVNHFMHSNKCSPCFSFVNVSVVPKFYNVNINDSN